MLRFLSLLLYAGFFYGGGMMLVDKWLYQSDTWIQAIVIGTVAGLAFGTCLGLGGYSLTKLGRYSNLNVVISIGALSAIGFFVGHLVAYGVHYLPHGSWEKQETFPGQATRFVIRPLSEPEIYEDNQVVYVQTIDGALYTQIRDDTGLHWVEGEATLKVSVLLFSAYRRQTWAYPAPPIWAKVVDSYIGANLWPEATRSVRFIIVDDGSVWRWERTDGVESIGGFLFWCLAGPTIGFLSSLNLLARKTKHSW